MSVLLLFAFISGLVTILAPCIWPLLPIILSSTTTGERRKPLGITLGIITSFAFFTLTISYIVRIFPFDPDILRLFAVVVIGALGLALVVPRFNELLEGWVSRISGSIGAPGQSQREGLVGGFVTGAALGTVWSPCAGPILATIATLAATQQVTAQVVLVTVVYVTGVGIPLLLFATAGSHLFTKSRLLSSYTGRIQQIFGVIMILTAIAIFTNYDKILEARLLNAFPSYSQFINDLEGRSDVKKQLEGLRGETKIDEEKIEDMNLFMPKPGQLQNEGPAPEFAGITKWLNIQDPLTIESLRGKVVLIDFWTYSCINCIRTLPHVTGWYEKYKDDGFVVVGVHTPEFEFEKKTANVADALKRHKINYPVAQDNDFATWRAYDNHYWPAKYLIDKDGIIRYRHFGEGKYEETERAIQILLAEAGSAVEEDMLQVADQTPHYARTPETYLGYGRLERFGSEERVMMGRQKYTVTRDLPEHYFGYEGTWDVGREEATAVADSAIKLQFVASKVFLVITPKTSKDRIKVLLDGSPIEDSDAGADVKDGVVIVDEPRLYHLVDLGDAPESHLLELQFQTPGTRVFAFTFG